MTIDEIQIECAKACGWTDVEHSKVMGNLQGTLGCRGWLQVPAYPTDLNAAFTLCDVLKKEGWIITIRNHGENEWNVCFHNYDDGPYQEHNPSLALAICEVFLKVKGLWK
jgi:hypothetical protein